MKKLPDGYESAKDLLSFNINQLKKEQKFAMNEIVKAINSDKIKLSYSITSSDIRYLIPDDKFKTVEINFTKMSKNLPKAVERGLQAGVLYSYLLQAYGLLKYKQVFENREVIKYALDMYITMVYRVLSHKGLTGFDDNLTLNKFKYLLTLHALSNTETVITNIQRFAETYSQYEDEDNLLNKYNKYIKSGVDFITFFEQVMTKEFVNFENIDNGAYVTVMIIRQYGFTASSMLDNLQFFIPIALDMSQTNTPLVYKEFNSLTSVISKAAYQQILSEL